VVRALGDRISEWMLMNEPAVFVQFGYGLGIHAPGLRSRTALLRASHVVNLAQGEAFRAVKAERSGLRVGSAFSMSPTEPASDLASDADAAERMHGWLNDFSLRPALRGAYPECFEAGLPAELDVREGDLERVRAPLDFVGINLYSRMLVRAERDRLGLGAKTLGMGGYEGPRTDFDWEVWPDALHDMVMRVTRDYARPVLEITENGCSYADGPGADGVIRDVRRIDFFRGYLAALHRAIEAGADVRGYHAWTLADNFEWAEGTAQRFGLAWTDFATCDRKLKQSGEWYGRVAAENGLDPEAEGTEVQTSGVRRL
jgi:beta-glucosidase